MIVAPQFSPVAKMLPIKILYNAFRQLDDVTKFLFVKRPQIKLKSCAHKVKGGL